MRDGQRVEHSGRAVAVLPQCAEERRTVPGRDAVKNNCAICHSTDYIVRQPRMEAKKWQAEVEKMKAVFGAPVSAADAKEIVDYLVRNYGSETKGKSAKK